VISAKSGLVNYTEGEVFLDGKAVDTSKTLALGDFKEWKELKTSLGRAEVLLSPGVFLRVAENTSVRLIANKLEDTKLDLLAGSVLLEVAEFNSKEQALSVHVGESTVEFSKNGLYRIEASPAELRVHDGSAVVVTGRQPVTVREGYRVELSTLLAPVKFDKEKGDAFYRWAARRSGYIAIANVAAAKKMHDGTSSYISSSNSSWVFNPYFGLYTFIPYSGMYRSPFGWQYFSPNTVERVYYRPPVIFANPNMGGGLGAGGGGGIHSYPSHSGGSMGTYSSGGSVAAPAPAASAPAPAGGARGAGGGGGGGRSSSGGR